MKNITNDNVTSVTSANRETRMKKDDKKYFLIMIVLFALSAFGGYGVGRLIGKIKKSGFDITDELLVLQEKLMYIIPVVSIIFGVSMAILSLVLISKAKKEFQKWDKEDEDIADKIENRLGIVVACTSIYTIVNMFLFACAVHLDFKFETSDKLEDILLILNIFALLFGFVIALAGQKFAIDITKRMNPEKEGSIFDVRFDKKWADTCDEAQMLNVYKSSYRAFKNGGATCLILWLICLIGDIAINIGLAPILCVTVIWVVLVVSYMRESAKLEKGLKI